MQTMASSASSQSATSRPISVLLFSDNSATRDAIRVGVGRRPSADIEIVRWFECATTHTVINAVESEKFDLLILDGEASPEGGMSLARQLKSEIFDSPPVLVLIARQEDGWLASWSLAESAVVFPNDPMTLANAVTRALKARD